MLTCVCVCERLCVGGWVYVWVCTVYVCVLCLCVCVRECVCECVCLCYECVYVCMCVCITVCVCAGIMCGGGGGIVWGRGSKLEYQENTPLQIIQKSVLGIRGKNSLPQPGSHPHPLLTLVISSLDHLPTLTL